MVNLKSINSTISQKLPQAQEAILVIFKKLQKQQAHMNTKKPVTKNNNRDNKSKNYYWTHGRTCNEKHSRPICNHPKEGHHVGDTLETLMGGDGKCRKEYGNHK